MAGDQPVDLRLGVVAASELYQELEGLMVFGVVPPKPFDHTAPPLPQLKILGMNVEIKPDMPPDEIVIRTRWHAGSAYPNGRFVARITNVT